MQQRRGNYQSSATASPNTARKKSHHALRDEVVELDLIGTELGGMFGMQKLFRDAALLMHHKRRALGLPHLQRGVHRGGIELDVNEPG